MIESKAAMLHPLTTASGRKLLAGRMESAIAPGDCLVLVKADGDAYRLIRISADPTDPRDPLTLASFLLPEQINEAELQTALEIADEAHRPPTATSKAKRTRHHRGART